jgi:DNA-directed RNA polymerase specialized sigma24 family protein
MMPAVRTAIERHWPDTLHVARSILGDENLASDIMERAIEQAVAYLADLAPENHEDVSAILSRFCRQEVGRRHKERAQFVLIDFSTGTETSCSHSPFSAAEAAIDAERIVRDAPPDVREAMLMRYGNSDFWSDIAATMATSANAIRKKCKRSRPHPRKIGTPQ